MGSADEIMQMCRLCLVKDQVNIPIFDEPTDIKQTFLKISSCLPVKVSREDNLPKKICDDCSYKLDVAYQFRNTSSSSEKQLIQLLEQFGIPAQTAISGKSEISVKLENVITEDGNICPDTQNYILQQQKLPYQQSFAEFGEASSSDAPPRKRAKRASATSKKSATATSVQEILTDPLVDSSPAATITKAEEDSNDSDDMVLSTFASASATSANDQAGPSGVGKGNIDAPATTKCVFNVPQEELQVAQEDGQRAVGKIETIKCKVQYSCKVCDKVYTTKKSFKNHSKTHDPNYVIPNFECEHCGEIKHTKQTFKHHLAKHTGYANMCEICGKIYASKDNFREHEKTHTGEKSGVCHFCGKSFTGRSTLRLHLITHAKEKPYSCPTCDKTFCQRIALTVHLRTHTKEKPYKCTLCPKGFVTKTSLHYHTCKSH